jgi:hypothetical protein
LILPQLVLSYDKNSILTTESDSQISFTTIKGHCSEWNDQGFLQIIATKVEK